MIFNPFYTDNCSICQQPLENLYNFYKCNRGNGSYKHYSYFIYETDHCARVETALFLINYYTEPNETYIFNNADFPTKLILKIKGHLSINWNDPEHKIKLLIPFL